MLGIDGKTATELRARAIVARDLAARNAHDTTVAPNLRRYADDLDAAAMKLDIPAADSAET
jgi:hypothetical protein